MWNCSDITILNNLCDAVNSTLVTEYISTFLFCSFEEPHPCSDNDLGMRQFARGDWSSGNVCTFLSSGIQIQVKVRWTFQQKRKTLSGVDMQCHNSCSSIINAAESNSHRGARSVSQCITTQCIHHNTMHHNTMYTSQHVLRLVIFWQNHFHNPWMVAR